MADMSSAPDAPDDATRVATEGLADCRDEDAYDADDPPEGDRGPSGGTRYLTELADLLRGAGLSVKEYDGWRQRHRSTGGYNGGPKGIIVHHTASPPSFDGQRDADYMTKGCDVAPMANLYLDRKGQWWVLAAGATNTNGKGGPWGPLPKDAANSRVIGIEAGNNGLGEPWPEVMQDAYVTGVAALADRYGIDSNNVLAHHEWAPGRKMDPAGPSRFGSINASKSWDMNTFRTAVNAKRGTAGTLKVVPPHAAATSAATYLVQPGDAWWSIAAKTLGDPAKTWPALAAANGGASRVLRPGDVLTLPGGATAPAAAPAAAGSAPAAAGFPGEAKLGLTGPVVLAWQKALIAHGVIADTPGNRDSGFGEGLERKVRELQQSWGWTDADGVAGSHTWTKLHGGA